MKALPRPMPKDWIPLMDESADMTEQTFLLNRPDGPELFVHHVPPGGREGEPRPALYVHGATFPSELSVGFRFDAASWIDTPAAAGFDPWAFDFAGFGHSGRYAEVDAPSDGRQPLGRVEVGAAQLTRVVEFVVERSGRPVSIIAHSWGTLVAGRVAQEHPHLIDRLVYFGPIVPRPDGVLPTGMPQPGSLGSWLPVSVDAQYRRFVADVPVDQPPVLHDRHFRQWAAAYLATDPTSTNRTPASVRVPAGPFADILDAWCGASAYIPGAIQAPTLIVRGEWDTWSTTADAEWLVDNRPQRVTQDVVIPRATHVMHLEENRHQLYRAARRFLASGHHALEEEQACLS
jgi:pimeloyl-ACP methyl ester carboxylesterase